MSCFRNVRSASLALLGVLIAGCGSGEPIAPPDNPGGPLNLVLGDTTPMLTLDSGQSSRVHHLTASVRTEVAIFVQAVDAPLRMEVQRDDGLDLGVTFSGYAPDTVLLTNRSDRFSLPAGSDYKVVISRGAPEATSPLRYRLFAYRVNRAPEHGPGTIVLSQVRSEEDLETSADIDEYALVGQEGKDLVGYLAEGDPGRRSGASIGFYPKNSEQPLSAVGIQEVGIPLEDNGTGLTTIPIGPHVVRAVGDYYTLPSRYTFVIRQGSRLPETAPATVGTGTVISEALDYTGDIDEFTVHGTPGVLVDLVLERNSPEPILLGLDIFDRGQWHGRAILDNNPANSSTGAMAIPLGGDIQFRVDIGAYQTGVRTTGRGAYRVRVLEIDPAPETAPVALTGTDSIIGERIEDFGDRDEFALAWPVAGLVNIVMRSSVAVDAPLRLDLTTATGDSVRTLFLPSVVTVIESGQFSLPAGNYRVRVIGMDQSGMPSAFRGPYGAYFYFAPVP